ncbi:MAG: iron-containing alcohol dehydrogenase [Candidatus Helarchaeales archaeon]
MVNGAKSQFSIPFEIARIPSIHFGPGKIAVIKDFVAGMGKNVLLVTGGKSLKRSGKLNEITGMLREIEAEYHLVAVSSEPSPSIVDSAASEARDKNIDVVISIGGGSVLDAGKAISAMIPQAKGVSVKDFLEGVGTRSPDGRKIPFIAVPTTSGTGSEATKNAVISEIGPDGFKKSLRHDNYVPDLAIIDPDLMVSCPPDISAACGMDALTQLIEAFVSTKASPMTDALAWSGLQAITENLSPACTTKRNDLGVRGAVAYGALMSGICLANAGLGIVHGLASPIGGFSAIPHGVVCGTLLAEATRINIEALKRMPKSPAILMALEKYAKIGSLLSGDGRMIKGKMDRYLDVLVEKLENMVNELKIPRLGKFGLSEADVDGILERAGLKNNPVQLDRDEIKQIILRRI